MAKEIKSELQKQADRIRVVTEEIEKAEADEKVASDNVNAAAIALVDAQRELLAVRSHRFALNNIRDNEVKQTYTILNEQSPHIGELRIQERQY